MNRKRHFALALSFALSLVMMTSTLVAETAQAAQQTVQPEGSKTPSTTASEGALWDKYLYKTAVPAQQTPRAPSESGSPADPPAPQPARAGQPSAQNQPPVPSTPSMPTKAPPTSAAIQVDKDRMLGDRFDSLSLYIRHTTPFVSELVPTSLLLMDDTESLRLLHMVLAADATELRLRLQHKPSRAFTFECVPVNQRELERIQQPGLGLSDLAALFGPESQTLAAQLGPQAVASRTSSTSSPGITRLQSLYLTSAGKHLLASDSLESLEDLKRQKSLGTNLFDSPAGYAVWMQTTLFVAGTQTSSTVPQKLSLWIGLQPTDSGWAFAQGSNARDFLPQEFSESAALPPSATEQFGAGSPYLTVAFHGSFLSAFNFFQNWIDSGEQKALFEELPGLLAGIESVAFSFGGTNSDMLGTMMPGGFLTLTGKNKTLDELAGRFMTESRARWVGTTYPQWQTASVSQGAVFGTPLPLPLLVARKDRTLVMGCMSADNFVSGRPLAQAIAPAGPNTDESVRIPHNVSSLSFIDVDSLWRTLGNTLAPGSPLRLLLVANNAPAVQQLDSVRELTPPLRQIISWTNSPNPFEGGGIILINRKAPNNFSLKVARLMQTLGTSH